MGTILRALTSEYRTPHNNRMPVAGSGLYWPLHGSLESAIAGVPALTEVVTLGAASSVKWDTQGYYTLPENNGVTNQIGLHAFDDATFAIDDVLTLEGMAAGTCLYVTSEIEYGDVGTTGTIWGYGKNASTGLLALLLSAAEALQIQYRATTVSGGSIVTTSLTKTGGAGLAGLTGRVAVAAEIRATSDSLATVSVLAGTAASPSTYSLAIDLSQGGTGLPPGRYAASASAHGGFSVAQRNGTTPSDWFGRGAANTGRVGAVAARKFAAYDAARLNATWVSMLSRPRAMPEPMLEAA